VFIGACFAVRSRKGWSHHRFTGAFQPEVTELEAFIDWVFDAAQRASAALADSFIPGS
jgi:hypothetical protein